MHDLILLPRCIYYFFTKLASMTLFTINSFAQVKNTQI